MKARTFTTTLLTISTLFVFIGDADAQKKKRKPKKKTQSERKKALSPQEQLKTFKLPEGFVIELVASEKNGLINPIDLTFDDSGRLWTQTAEMYPLDPNVKLVGRKSLEAIDNKTIGKQSKFKEIRSLYQLKTRGTDKILVIGDPTKQVEGDISVFAEGMTIPQSILPYKDGVFVAHGSEMLYLNDTDGDGKFDEHKTVLTGFGFTDSHTMSHTLVRGPGGWVHFSHGALNKGLVTAPKSGNTAVINYSKIARFSLDGNKIEVVNNGLQNIWGFQLKANGQWYGTEANDLFWSLVPLHPKMGYKGIGNDRLKPYQPFPGEFHKFKVDGTGISGLAYDENGSKGFPKEWKNAGLLANPITSSINAVIADRNPDGTIVSKHLPDFLTCSDDWFRPVNIEFGPDGCLYIVDWYNKIISHNEVDRDHPDRDKTHGRIWRVRHESQKPAPIPNITKASNVDLLKHLSAEILWEKRAAWHQIVDRGASELTPELTKIANDPTQDTITRIHALWSLEGLGKYDLNLLTSLTQDKDADIKREALRSLETFKPSIADIVTLTKPLINDPHYMVKEQTLRALADVETANTETIQMLVSAAKPVTKEKTLSKKGDILIPFGKAYSNDFQRFLALSALEQYPLELKEFLDSPEAKKMPAANINEATQALPKTERAEKIIVAIKSGQAELDANNLIALSPSLNEPKVLNALKDQLDTKEFIELALNTQSSLRSSMLLKALEPGLKKLISSSNKEEQQLAITTAISYHSPAINEEVLRMIEATPLKDITIQQLDILTITPKQNLTTFNKLISAADVSLSTKLKAIIGLSVASPKDGKKAFTSLHASLDENNKKSLVSSATNNGQGMLFVLDLIKNKTITSDQLSHPAKALMIETHPNHPASKSLATSVAKTNAHQQKEATAKVKKYTASAQTLNGNIETGKQMFSICLQCHEEGGQGYDYAPSLDGSSNRDLNHLINAIVKPNDAIEGGYRLYRITKINGDNLEGYMINQNANGTTLGSMGGSKKFIPKEQIKKERFINGKSFMLSSFDNYTEQQMADLVSYIKTL